MLSGRTRSISRFIFLAAGSTSLIVGTAVVPASATATESGRRTQIPAWFDQHAAEDLIEEHASGSLTSQYFTFDSEQLIDPLSRGGQDYVEPQIEIDITSVSVQPPDGFYPSYTTLWRKDRERGAVYVEFTRTASLEIDLTGATDIQGFDPAEGISTQMADKFAGVFVNDGDATRPDLTNVVWLAPHDKALTDPPIGWMGGRSVVSSSADSRPAISAGSPREEFWLPNLGEPDSTDQILALSEDVERFQDSGSVVYRPSMTDSQKQDVVDYARRYATNPNQDYKYFPNDCTNFVSQAMLAGGWNTIARSGTRGDITKDPKLWAYRHMTWIYPESAEWATRTWTGVDEWFAFARNESERTRSLGNIWRYEPGDVIQANIDGFDDIDHSMVVTGKFTTRWGTTELLLSYHTNDRLDRKMSELIETWPDVKWYGHQT